MLRVLKILEMAWLMIATFSVIIGGYMLNQQGWDTAQWFFIGAVVSIIFFVFRRKQRLKIESEEKPNKSKNN